MEMFPLAGKTNYRFISFYRYINKYGIKVLPRSPFKVNNKQVYVI